MEVSNTPASSLTTDAIASRGRSNGLASDFETFLKMLTVQARNQDPLEPIDSTEYAAQLAQFSMVEQQVQTNDVLASLYGQIVSESTANFAGWVGMDARAAAPAWFDGHPIVVSPHPRPVADEVALVVRDLAGVEVDRVALPLADAPYSWTGIASDGTQLAPGLYSFVLENYSGGELLASETAEVYGRITEVQVQDGETVLIRDGGVPVKASEVTALR